MTHGSRFLNSETLAAAGLTVLAVLAGCATHRLSMDYEICVDRQRATRSVPETAIFYSGERFRLRVTAPEALYCYILNETPDGRYHVLYPRPEVRSGSALLASHSAVSVPERGHFQFAGTPGVETLIIYASREAVPELERVTRGQITDPRLITAELHDLEARHAQHSDLQKIQHADHTEVVLKSPSRDAVMVNRIRLEHREPGQ